jgi:hypothetical protein
MQRGACRRQALAAVFRTRAEIYNRNLPFIGNTRHNPECGRVWCQRQLVTEDGYVRKGLRQRSMSRGVPALLNRPGNYNAVSVLRDKLHTL